MLIVQFWTCSQNGLENAVAERETYKDEVLEFMLTNLKLAHEMMSIQNFLPTVRKRGNAIEWLHL